MLELICVLKRSALNGVAWLGLIQGGDVARSKLNCLLHSSAEWNRHHGRLVVVGVLAALEVVVGLSVGIDVGAVRPRSICIN